MTDKGTAEPHLPLGLGCFLAALSEGRGDARQLSALAELAERHGNGRLATTPWRAFALPAVSDPEPLQTLASCGFLVEVVAPAELGA